MKKVFFYDYPVVRLGIAEEDGAIRRVFFDDGGKSRAPKTAALMKDFAPGETPLIKRAAAQLAEYFGGKRKTFDLPLALGGTAFQAAVWKALREIPYGKTLSYGELAARAGTPRACRAAGTANNRNPVVIIVPCHRVIGADGGLTGYGGGLALKQYLLDLERQGA
jgi:methylated-DNA-[protein]-cysteine S-methyltransferase